MSQNRNNLDLEIGSFSASESLALSCAGRTAKQLETLVVVSWPFSLRVVSGKMRPKMKTIALYRALPESAWVGEEKQPSS